MAEMIKYHEFNTIQNNDIFGLWVYAKAPSVRRYRYVLLAYSTRVDYSIIRIIRRRHSSSIVGTYKTIIIYPSTRRDN